MRTRLPCLGVKYSASWCAPRDGRSGESERPSQHDVGLDGRGQLARDGVESGLDARAEAGHSYDSCQADEASY